MRIGLLTQGVAGLSVEPEVRDAVESAASAAVHGLRHADGMMRMYPVPRLEIAAGASVRLEPGGYHLMVGGLAAAPRAGAVLPFCLRLEDGAEQCAEARVRAIGE